MSIVDAKTVDELMTLLDEPPFELGVPTLAQLPKNSPLVPLWKASITLQAVQPAGSYQADAQLAWRLILDLIIVASTFQLADFPAAAGAGKEQTMPTAKSAPVRRQAAPARKPAKRATDDGPTVELQATFEYGSAPNVKEITLNTGDLKNLVSGQIKFTLDHEVELGDLKDFLDWAGSSFGFTPPTPSEWPSPFSDLASLNVTIVTLVIDQAKGHYKLAVSMALPTPKPLPIIGVKFKQVGVAIAQGAA